MGTPHRVPRMGSRRILPEEGGAARFLFKFRNRSGVDRMGARLALMRLGVMYPKISS